MFNKLQFITFSIVIPVTCNCLKPNQIKVEKAGWKKPKMFSVVITSLYPSKGGKWGCIWFWHDNREHFDPGKLKALDHKFSRHFLISYSDSHGRIQKKLEGNSVVRDVDKYHNGYEILAVKSIFLSFPHLISFFIELKINLCESFSFILFSHYSLHHCPHFMCPKILLCITGDSTALVRVQDLIWIFSVYSIKINHDPC